MNKMILRIAASWEKDTEDIFARCEIVKIFLKDTK